MPKVTLNANRSLHVEEHGQGDPLVLLHGFPLDGSIWDAQLEALSDSFRVIVPDLTGFGRSKSDAPFTIESLARDVHELLQNLGGGALPCALAGLSMGGYVALAFARAFPADLGELILIDTRAPGDNTEGKQKRDAMIELVRSEGSGAVADRMMPNLIAPGRKSDANLVGRLRKIMEACPAKTIEHACLAMRDRQDYSNDLPSIAARTLIIVGEHDVLTPPAAAEAMRAAIPTSALLVVPGAGHMTPMEAPQVVNDAIRVFLGGGTRG